MKGSYIALTTDGKSNEEENEQTRITLEVVLIYQHLYFTEYLFRNNIKTSTEVISWLRIHILVEAPVALFNSLY